MTLTINLQARQMAVLVAVAVAVVFAVWWASPAVSQTAGPDPVASFAVVARADNPVDALAAAAVAGQLGAPVYLSFTDSLDEHARQGLVDTDPDVVVLAGGPVALSAQVEDQVAALLPDAQVRRIGGGGRTETARLLNELPGELGIARPVLAGATVAGDVGIDGALTVAGTDVLDRLNGLEARTGTLASQLATADSRIAALEAEVDGLQATLDGVTRTTIAGLDTLRFEAMNLQLVNGSGTTGGTPNGEGNLIVGYNTPRAGSAAADRAGSHYLVIGDFNHWTHFGGIVAGRNNTASGDSASVTGVSNTASGLAASVSGGTGNTASGFGASVSGGNGNTASATHSSVSGGRDNTASSSSASVSGGVRNTASGPGSSVSGGNGNTASDFDTSVAGGRNGTVSDAYDSLIGNQSFPDS